PPGEAEHADGDQAGADRDEGAVEGDPRAIADPAQDVPPEPVGAEERRRPGRGLDAIEVRLVGWTRRERAGEERRGDDQEREEPADDPHGAAQDAPKLSG